jgi:hypothetical protein
VSALSVGTLVRVRGFWRSTFGVIIAVSGSGDYTVRLLGGQTRVMECIRSSLVPPPEVFNDLGRLSKARRQDLEAQLKEHQDES